VSKTLKVGVLSIGFTNSFPGLATSARIVKSFWGDGRPMASPLLISPKVRFATFELDSSAGKLFRSGIPIKLQPQPLRVLLLLTKRPGQVVTREEIQRCLWGDSTFVDFERGINFSINQIRAALSDNAEKPRYIETLPRIGYRFIAPVTGGGLRVTAPTTTADSSGLVYEWPAESRTISTVSEEKSRARLGFPVVPWKWSYVLAVAALAVLAAVGYVAHRLLSHSRDLDLRDIQLTRLTENGRVQSVAISPDGRYLAYARREGDEESLWLRQVVTGGDIQLLPTGTGFHGLTFSPDSNYIYFVRSDEKDPYFKYLYSMAALGGTARKLITDVDSPVTFDPDGHQFAYEHCVQPRNDIELKIANADGSGDHLLATIHDGSGFLFQPGPNWSRDGRTIAVPVHIINQHQRWVLDGSMRELYSSSQAIGRPVWLPRGNALIFPHADEVTHRSQLWTVSFPLGKAQRFTNDLSDYGTDLDITSYGDTIAAVTSKAVSNVWTAPAAKPSATRQVTSEPLAMFDIAEAFDGKLLTLGEDGTLWMMHTDGSQRVRFSDVRDAASPTPCGHSVIFTAVEKDTVALIRVDRDGTHPTTLARGNLWGPACSGDGNFVFFANGEQPQRIWKVPLMGGTPLYVSHILGDQATGVLSISPDGKLLAYPYTQYGRVPAQGWRVAVISVNGSPPLKQFDAPGGMLGVRWSPSGNGLQYVMTQNGAANLWEQPLAGGNPKQLTRFTTGQIFDFNWSLDHTRLLLTRGDVSSDAVLLGKLH
jgi:DNA-binding winged helix-turn-helix (wHTH) protein/Tol biopolymer transport system component